MPETYIIETLEDIVDMIAAELSKGQTGRSYDEVRKEIIRELTAE